MAIATLTTAFSAAFISCTSTSVMGLSKAAYVDGELEELNARTEGMESLEERLEEMDELSERVDALDESMAEARETDEEMLDLAEEFRERLDGLSRETLLELVEALMEHLEKDGHEPPGSEGTG